MSHETFIRCDNHPNGARCESREPVDGPHAAPAGWLQLRRRRAMTAEDLPPFDRGPDAMITKFKEIAGDDPKTEKVLNGLEEIYAGQQAARFEGQTVLEQAIVCPGCQRGDVAELLETVAFDHGGLIPPC